jgi:endonuclease YncB( thermonuclease family)
MVPFTRRFGKPLALEMLRLGWATTYEQAGAEYGKWGKDEFLKVEAQAKSVQSLTATAVL